MATTRARESGWAGSGVFLTLLVGIVALVGSLVYLFIGIAEQNAMNQTYDVGFGTPGEDCPRGEAFFDETSGEILGCVRAGGVASGPLSLPGFSDEQNESVAALAGELGADGLSVADQREIQALVGTYAATVPASQRPRYDEGVYAFGLYGTRLAVVSVVVALLALVVMAGAMRLWIRVARR